ncbi:hypothetical protein [Nocardioides speluncae]|uniref:hypothetical protein n=1 Tax=Nocardioides speluncae TaxID=2670337 RepID=UPI0012B16351|nr:hypothetical protein [Nocardioides speluncae]
MHTSTRTAAAALAAVPALALLAPPSSAAPLVRDRLHFADSFVVGEFCGTDTALIEYDVTVQVVVNPHGPNGLAYHLETVHGYEVSTNLETGEGVRQERDFASKDQRVVDNGDGTLTIDATVSGSSRDTWSAGPTFIDAGLRRVRVLIDHGGTPADPFDDTFVDELSRTEVGRHDTTGRDFCTDWAEFTS